MVEKRTKCMCDFKILLLHKVCLEPATCIEMKLLSNLRKMYELELDNRCTKLALSLFFAKNLLIFHLPYRYICMDYGHPMKA